MVACLIWWGVILVLGISVMPIGAVLFRSYRDCGWMFSKVLGIVMPAFLIWLLANLGMPVFTAPGCIGAVLLVFIINGLFAWKRLKKGKGIFWLTRENGKLIIGEELLFLAMFLFWTYLVGFRPEAYDTEKFMDYGFLASLMRSTTLPAPDIWYAGEPMNYYYGGQYFAAFLTKLTFTRVQEAYNLMRTLVASLAFMLPFALVRQLWEDLATKKHGRKRSGAAIPVGIFSGLAVAFAGNMHYVLAGPLFRFCGKFLGHENDYSYWFSNSTRYIGHYPEGTDQTIHEYPCYSFVLGDLHAHVVNLMLVLFLVGLLYAMLHAVRWQGWERFSWKMRLLTVIRDPHLLVCGFFLGLFQFTNYWDYPIYLVVTMAVVVYRFLLVSRFQLRKTLTGSVMALVWLVLLSFITALPFQLNFENMVSGIALAQQHSDPRQFLVIWAYPLLLSGVFVVWLFLKHWKKTETGSRFRTLLTDTHPSDLFVAGLLLCAAGLVLIPELIYIRDIYEASYARANTMFKLTYQAFTLFGIGTGYVLVRFLANRSRTLYVIGILGSICFFSTLGYFGRAVSDWMGDVLDRDRFQGLDATAFLEKRYPADAAAIRWLNENAGNESVLVEACGDSYSDYERVSAMTGLPCVMGWYVHEWLWRGDIAQLQQRQQDVEDIYTAGDAEEAERLLEQYRVAYLYVGDLERQAYGELDDELLRSLGEVVFEEDQTYIVAISE